MIVNVINQHSVTVTLDTRQAIVLFQLIRDSFPEQLNTVAKMTTASGYPTQTYQAATMLGQIVMALENVLPIQHVCIHEAEDTDEAPVVAKKETIN